MRNAEHPRPRILFSACLTGDRVRYNSRLVRNGFARKLMEYAEVLKLCPEVELGLGVPRGKIILYRRGGSLRLFQPATGSQLTRAMHRLSRRLLSALEEVDGFLLKSGSPSCGLSGTRVYRDPWGRRYRGSGKGLFALEVLRRFPHLPAEDEERLKDKERRLRFLLIIFALAEFRSLKDPARFHSRVRSVLRVFAPGLERKLAEEEDYHAYRAVLLRALERVPTPVLKDAFVDLVPPELLVPSVRRRTGSGGISGGKA